LNLRPHGPKPRALPAALHPEDKTYYIKEMDKCQQYLEMFFRKG
jgi:hypothetical protein